MAEGFNSEGANVRSWNQPLRVLSAAPLVRRLGGLAARWPHGWPIT